jgi:uncharacterized membrane protein YhaH (DUF805 family)
MLACLSLAAVMASVYAFTWLIGATRSAETFIIAVFSMAFILCNYTLTAQRLRDIGVTGWLALLWIPSAVADQYVGGAVSLGFLIILCVVPGTNGENRYGPNPLEYGSTIADFERVEPNA